MKTRVLAGLALLAALSPGVQAQYTYAPSAPAEPAYRGYSQPKEDCPPRAWVSSEYLRWRIKDSPLDFPLLTTSTPTGLGVLEQPGTVPLFGGEDYDYGALNGLRVSGGLRLDSDGCFALVGSFFRLERGGENFNFASDATGNPVLSRPVQVPGGAQAVLPIAIPGLIAGSFNGSTSSELFGSDINLSSVIYRCNSSRLEFLTGFRYLRLEEQLTATSTAGDLGTGAAFSFLGTALPTGSTVGVSDSFETHNNIYAPQLGARYTWESGVWSLGLVGKVGLGWNNKRVEIAGQTTATTPPASAQSAPGGLLAQTSNIGSYTARDFVVVPEVGANLGVNVFPWLRLTGGYNFLYINQVVRPGPHVDPVVNPAIAPLGTTFGAGGVARPAFQMRDSDFFAHGWSAGVQLRW